MTEPDRNRRWTLAFIAVIKDQVSILDEISDSKDKLLIQLMALRRTTDNMIEVIQKR